MYNYEVDFTKFYTAQDIDDYVELIIQHELGGFRPKLKSVALSEGTAHKGLVTKKASGSLKKAARKKMAARDSLPGRVVDVPGDGNCFFSAVAHEVKRKHLGNFEHQALREKAIKYLQDDLSLFMDYPPEDEEHDEYLARMSKDGIWAEGAVIEALAKSLNVHFCILELRTNRAGMRELFPFHINEGDDRQTIILIRNEGVHYKVLEHDDLNTVPTLDLFSESFEVKSRQGHLNRRVESVEFCSYTLAAEFIDKQDSKSYLVAVTPALNPEIFNGDMSIYLYRRPETKLQTDVFEEVMLLIQSRHDANVKILFPYSFSDIMWLLGEIKFSKRGLDYEIEICVHNSYKNDIVSDEDKSALKQLVSVQINRWHPEAHIASCVFKLSPYAVPRFNADEVNESGILTATEIIRRIKGQTLNVVTPYTGVDIVHLKYNQMNQIVAYRPQEETCLGGFLHRHARRETRVKLDIATLVHADVPLPDADILPPTVMEADEEVVAPLPSSAADGPKVVKVNLPTENDVGRFFPFMKLAEGDVEVYEQRLTAKDLAVFDSISAALLSFRALLLERTATIEDCLCFAQQNFFCTPNLSPLYTPLIVQALAALLFGITQQMGLLKDFGYLLTGGLNVTLFEQFFFYISPDLPSEHKARMWEFHPIKLAFLSKILSEDLPEIIRFLGIVRDLRAFLVDPTVSVDDLFIDSTLLADLAHRHRLMVASAMLSQRKALFLKNYDYVRSKNLTHGFKHLYAFCTIVSRYDALDRIEKVIAQLQLPTMTDTAARHAWLNALLVVGENIKKIPPEVRALYPAAPWQLKDIRDEIEHQFEERKRSVTSENAAVFHYDAAKAEVLVDFLEGEYIAQGLSWQTLARDLTSIRAVVNDIKATLYAPRLAGRYWQEWLRWNAGALEVDVSTQATPQAFLRRAGVVFGFAEQAEEIDFLLTAARTKRVELAEKLSDYLQAKGPFLDESEVKALYSVYQDTHSRNQLCRALIKVKQLQPKLAPFAAKKWLINFEEHFARGKRIGMQEILQYSLGFLDNIHHYLHELLHSNEMRNALNYIITQKLIMLDSNPETSKDLPFLKNLDPDKLDEFIPIAPASLVTGLLEVKKFYQEYYDRHALTALAKNPKFHEALAYDVRIVLSLLRYIMDFPRVFGVGQMKVFQDYQRLEQLRNYLAHDDYYRMQGLGIPYEMEMYQLCGTVIPELEKSLKIILENVQKRQESAVKIQKMMRRCLERTRLCTLAENEMQQFEVGFKKLMKDYPHPKLVLERLKHIVVLESLPIFGTEFANMWLRLYDGYLQGIVALKQGRYATALVLFKEQNRQVAEVAEERRAHRHRMAGIAQ